MRLSMTTSPRPMADSNSASAPTQPKTPRQISRLLALISLFFLLIAAPASAQLQARDHHVEFVSPDLVTIPFADLLDGQSATIVLRQEPRHGYLEPNGGAFIYHPTNITGGPFYGTDTFSYFLVNGGASSGIGRVTIKILPERQPLAGRWETQSCNRELCEADGCEPGDGAELGWYDTREGTFFLCDWEGGQDMEVCGRYRVPRSLFRGGEAMVIDWDEDGWDEPALQDPLTGDILIFESTGQDCPGECKGHCLDVVATYRTSPTDGGHGGRYLPAAASWLGLSPNKDAIGAYDPVTREVGLGLIHGQFREAFAFSAAEPVRTLSGDWQGAGETLGLWSHATGSFEFLVDNSSNGSLHYQPGLMDEIVARSLPFGAKLSACTDSDIAFFDPESEEIHIEPLFDTDPDKGGVKVRVPTDPAGWPRETGVCWVTPGAGTKAP